MAGHASALGAINMKMSFSASVTLCSAAKIQVTLTPRVCCECTAGYSGPTCALHGCATPETLCANGGTCACSGTVSVRLLGGTGFPIGADPYTLILNGAVGWFSTKTYSNLPVSVCHPNPLLKRRVKEKNQVAVKSN